MDTDVKKIIEALEKAGFTVHARNTAMAYRFELYEDVDHAGVFYYDRGAIRFLEADQREKPDFKEKVRAALCG
ncbi:hypothetical protein A2716_02240 [candidate division WWE3 bacterium RIFCSPHIGHO2_01_FULL_40_23]|uniref:Uncharacterized protein n=1 Tax=candidate division WWE3 bacterium RIFCSPLOWO2_01_FULL_41_18 TaxID=1802625 RepID=A0A1F4VEY3_UNCKA|nr:MAG: hypothetical protein A2716_02240 [candidate division WWE3 bacterium RIFCSPHIGHO2_01_FULL_40_23]OGC55806.1 MAG: hypothetical protein A3A78_02090 [candidate division WWE3 bacterium RIFCSPLOWO2_01_FULL_41_18]